MKYAGHCQSINGQRAMIKCRGFQPTRETNTIFDDIVGDNAGLDAWVTSLRPEADIELIVSGSPKSMGMVFVREINKRFKQMSPEKLAKTTAIPMAQRINDAMALSSANLTYHDDGD